MKKPSLLIALAVIGLCVSGCAEPVTNDAVSDDPAAVSESGAQAAVQEDDAKQEDAETPADEGTDEAHANLIPSVDKAGLEEAMKDSNVVFIDFTATWCLPCRKLKPHLKKMAEELDGKVRFVEVDFDKQTDLVEKYEVESLPTLIVLSGGEPVKRLVGAKDVDAIRAAIDGAL